MLTGLIVVTISQGTKVSLYPQPPLPGSISVVHAGKYTALFSLLPAFVHPDSYCLNTLSSLLNSSWATPPVSVCSSCCNKVPRTGRLTQLKLSSHVWRLEVQGQGVGRVGSSSGCEGGSVLSPPHASAGLRAPRLTHAHLLAVSSHCFLSLGCPGPNFPFS